MKKIIWMSILLIMYSIPGISQDLKAKEIITKADDLQRGENNKGEMSMTIIRPKWQRTITMKT